MSNYSSEEFRSITQEAIQKTDSLQYISSQLLSINSSESIDSIKFEGDKFTTEEFFQILPSDLEKQLFIRNSVSNYQTIS